jgi:hypothetical protein
LGEGQRGWKYNSRRPSDPPGHGRRHGKKDEQSKAGISGPWPQGKDPTAKNISRRERTRASDEAIASEDPAGQNNPLASQGPLDRTVPGNRSLTPAQNGYCSSGSYNGSERTELCTGENPPYGILERDEETECMIGWPFATQPQRADTLEAIDLNITAPRLYSALNEILLEFVRLSGYCLCLRSVAFRDMCD